MNRLTKLFLLFCININLSLALITRECKQKDVCSCVWSDTNVEISLHNLNDRNKPRFQNMELVDSTGTKTGYKLDYNPCTTFRLHGDTESCTDVVSCQSSDDNKVHYNAGKPKQLSISTKSNNLVFTYDGGVQSNYGRMTQVTLKCDKSATTPQVSTPVENKLPGGTSSIYMFTLTTNCACDSGCSSSGGGSQGLSTGSLLCILFFVFLIVYLVGGFLFLKFYKKYEGTEAVPQYEFWKDFPAKVKDGFVFTKEKIFNKDNQYQEI